MNEGHGSTRNGFVSPRITVGNKISSLLSSLKASSLPKRDRPLDTAVHTTKRPVHAMKTPFFTVALLATASFVLADDMHTKMPAKSGKEHMAMTEDAKVDSINTVCPIDGMKLGSMGKPTYVTYHGKKIGLCNAEDAATFKKNPAKYAALAEKNQGEGGAMKH